MNELTRLIDEALALVRDPTAPTLARQWMTQAEVERLCVLGEDAVRRAAPLGLAGCFPQVHDLRLDVEVPDIISLPPVKVVSRFNLPGLWDAPWPPPDDASLCPPRVIGGGVGTVLGSYTATRTEVTTLRWLTMDRSSPQVAVFQPCPGPRWFRDIEALRALAEACSTDQAKPNELAGALQCDAHALSETEYAVLQQLARDHPQAVKITDLAVDIDRGRTAVGEAVTRLEELRLVARPKGERSGVAITPAGVSALRPGDLPAHLRPAGR